ncbi:alpha/beta fold hydrolase [Gryllotalpicola protaetiae]|uniref:Alpha/beta fold hydrolase n=1 Tax=Gryllotalpicola protaetiae TaxID=2419771 RepID=A0A387BTY7_9MICO|nr:alpha/beta hydrolase [Gryllotalpicola protaetiae]AYG04506.1 alpha/beta fold hydrolase [Gryllotalpicola protaetiae]
METAVDTRAQAAELDARLHPIDWSAPDPGSTAFRFDAPSGSLAAWSIGDPANPRVVLVPGATGSKEDFVLLAPPLVEAGYFVESYDLAGQYESAAAGPSRVSGHWDYDLYLADFITFLEAGEPAHVLGYSFAGILAQLALAGRPELFRSLTLLTTPPLTGNVFRGIKIIGPIARFASPHAGAGLMIWGIQTNKNGVDERRLDFVRARLGITRRESVDDIIALMMDTPDVTAAVASAGVPLLVATGQHDLWPVRAHAEYADMIGAELAVYRTGHSPCETTPNQLALDMITTFRRAEQPA